MKTLSSYRVTIFVPEEVLENFIDKISPSIPSFLGNYDHVCWWSENGTEQSRKISETQAKQVPCRRVEFSMPADKTMLQQLIKQTILPAHPWEEPVILITQQEILTPDV